MNFFDYSYDLFPWGSQKFTNPYRFGFNCYENDNNIKVVGWNFLHATTNYLIWNKGGELMTLNSNRICYICGFDFDSEPTEERQEWPFIYCPCCKFHYGILEFEWDGYLAAREAWIDDGLKFGNKLNPEGIKWSLEIVLKQLNNLKKVNIENNIPGKKWNPNYTKEVDLERVKTSWFKAR